MDSSFSAATPFTVFLLFWATHLSRDIFQAFYVKKMIESPNLRQHKMLDFQGCPALSG